MHKRLLAHHRTLILLKSKYQRLLPSLCSRIDEWSIKERTVSLHTVQAFAFFFTVMRGNQ